MQVEGAVIEPLRRDCNCMRMQVEGAELAVIESLLPALAAQRVSVGIPIVEMKRDEAR